MLSSKNFIFLIFFFITKLIMSQDQPGLNFGGTKNEFGFDIIQCNDKGYLITGSTKSYGKGNSDILIIKLDETYNLQWIKTHGWFHNDVARAVIEVDDGFLLFGDSWDNGQPFLDINLIKIDYSGNFVWNQLYGTDSKDMGFDLLQLPLGDLILLGNTRGTDQAGDYLIIKTDINGNELWRKTFGSEFDDYGIEIVLNDDNTFLVIGTKAGFYNDVAATYTKVHDADMMLLCVDFDGNEIWRKIYGGTSHDFGYSLIKTEDGIYICGSTQSKGNGSFDISFQKTDNEGNVEWLKTFGGIEYEYGNSIARNDANEFYIFGTTKSFGQNQSADYYLVKTDDSGNEIWSLTIGGNFIEKGNKVIATSDSGALLIGQTNSFGNGEFDILLVKVNKNGIIEDLINKVDSTYVGEFQLYPNPVNNIGKFRTLSTTQKPLLYLELVSLSGQSSVSFSINSPDYSFSTSSLSSGIYIYNIRLSEDLEIISSGKLIVR